MLDGPEFSLRGIYRVQGKPVGGPSSLKGRWTINEQGELTSAIMNDYLLHHPSWLGNARVSLSSALINERRGEFEEQGDILYKSSNLVPLPGETGMDCNIIDVRKANDQWKARVRWLQSLCDDDFLFAAGALVGDILVTSANEYFVHEAGHSLGVDTETKYHCGYFRPCGRTLWPLVFIEELRADLLSFGAACQLLPSKDAAGVFLYNLLLRLGMQVQARAKQATDPYGSIPLMLFHLLLRGGWISSHGPGQTGIHLNSTNVDYIVDIMHQLTGWVETELVVPEQGNLSDARLAAARQYRELVSDPLVTLEFEQLILAAASMGWSHAVPTTGHACRF